MEKHENRIVAAAEQDLNQLFGFIADVLYAPKPQRGCYFRFGKPSIH